MYKVCKKMQQYSLTKRGRFYTTMKVDDIYAKKINLLQNKLRALSRF